MSSRNVAGNVLDRARLSKAGGIGSGGGGVVADVNGWVRPSDWPALPSDASNKIVILAKVIDTDANFAALTMTLSSGTYDVDWGDGTSTTGIASGSAAYHQYTYADGDLPAATSEGFKIATIVVTTSGGDITNMNLGTVHNQSGLYGNYSNPWLEVRANVPSATTIGFRGTARAFYLRKVEFTGLGAITALSNLFDNCYNLASVIFPAGSLSSVTSLSSTFINCANLMGVSWPSGSLASVTTASSCFSGCTSIEHLTFPSGSLGSSLTTMASMFIGCDALKSITFPSGSLGSVTSVAQTFDGCTSLEYIEFPSGALASITSFSTTFRNCTSLRHIKFPSTGLGAITITTNCFSGAVNLSRIENCDIPVSFTLPAGAFSAAALDEVYTALPSVSSQTITVTGNFGTTGDDPSIATGKGWTVTS